jgi:phosphoribosylformylglycinamidine cyclo-ligase
MEAGGVEESEAVGVFNLGLGMVIAVDPADADRALELAGPASVVGRVEAGDGRVRLT